MIGQLLVIFKLILLTHQQCTFSTTISNLTTQSVTLMNTNLNASQANYTLIDENKLGTYAIGTWLNMSAINSMDMTTPQQWNLTVTSNNSILTLTFKNKYVNWVKVSCIVWSSRRQDLTVGSYKIGTIEDYIDFFNESFPTQQEIKTNNLINNYDSSIAIAFLNGFKLAHNTSSSYIQLSVNAFKVGNDSIGISITNSYNTSISSITISYLIFSPFYSSFMFSGNSIKIAYSSSAMFYDVSGEIPETIYKFFGFSSINVSIKQSLKFEISIDQSSTIKSLANKQVQQLSLQYLFLFPSNKPCPSSCSSIINSNTCVDKCPTNTILINTEYLSFCRACSKQMHLAANANNSLCICEEGYEISNITGGCQQVKKKIVQSINQTDQIHSKSILGSKNNVTIEAASKQEKQSFNGKIAFTPSIVPVNSPNCSKINNSEPIKDKCVCMRGYVNLSNTCIAIVALGTPFSSQKPLPKITNTITAIKTTSACGQNQEFSITLNKCTCSAGYKLNASKCITICSNLQAFNLVTNSCICSLGYVRMNGQCIVCSSKSKYSSGSQICYPLPERKICRNGYILGSGVCLSCLAISISIKSQSGCSICQNGFVYNGVNCSCPFQVINSSCVGPVCGNRKIQANQNCDDGNVVNGDGCSSSCLVQQDYTCSNNNGIVSVCFKNVCGNGKITGGEQCDDNNTINGDGCSSLCLIEANYTCVGCISSCFNITVGNLTVLNTSSNTNNVYVVLQVPKNYTFKSSAIGAQFISAVFLSRSTTPRIVYCQQGTNGSNRFNCLIIFPSGVPINGFIMVFRYSYDGDTGAAIVDFKNMMRNSC